MNTYVLNPLISGAVLIGAAVFSFPGRDYVLIGLMLFLPLLDRRWPSPRLPRAGWNYFFWAGLLLIAFLLLVWRPDRIHFALATLLLAALPEEWFFRAYFMTRLGKSWGANLISSLLFSLLHGLRQDWIVALQVFVPSLFYGWLYQRIRDLPLLILVHALSNLVFVLFLAGFFATLTAGLR